MASDNFSQYPVIDLRPTEKFRQQHLENSANIPASQLESRTHELPERLTPINLIGHHPELQMAKQFLTTKGYQILEVLDLSQSNIADCFPATFLASHGRSKRYWQPASVVAHFCKNIQQTGANKRALDLACGAGRDCVYLGLNGWQVHAIDISQHALERLESFAQREKLNIQCQLVDLEKELDSFLATKQKFDLIVVVRYLHRPLLTKLDSLLNQSGHIIYQTFMQGCEKFGSPKNPRFLLQQGELARCFSSYTICLDQIDYLSDGRPVNSFIAQKESD